jgi:large subunit ribosomal protein L20
VRVKFVVPRRKRRKKILKLAKGYYGAQSRSTKIATQYVIRALSHAYTGRKLKKRQMRRLWIARINAAARENGLKYSHLIYGLKKLGIDLDRKTLAEIAFSDKEGFRKICDEVKKNIFQLQQ